MSHHNEITIQLVTWNGERYIPCLFESLRKQICRSISFIILDNGSTDGTVEAIEKEFKSFSFPYEFRKNQENLGFAGGHNQIFSLSDSKYLLLLNQDMYLMPDAIDKILSFMNQTPNAGSCAPRLMRWNFEAMKKHDTPIETSFTADIDALGLKIFRSRRVIDQYTRQRWDRIRQHLPEKIFPVFGVSGALPVYRRSALKQVQYQDGTLFDQRYHSYKEDVDLAFRLRSSGYDSFIVLDSVAYHDRTAAGAQTLSDFAASMNKTQQSSWARYHSWKNHLSTIYKNEYPENFIRDFPWIFWYEFKKLGWFLLFDRSVIKGGKEIWKNRIGLKQKRQWIKKQRKVAAAELRKWSR